MASIQVVRSTALQAALSQNSACLGMTNIRFHVTVIMDAVSANIAAATALRREGNAGEVADTMAYLASDDSSFLTDFNLDIDGGLYYLI